MKKFFLFFFLLISIKEYAQNCNAQPVFNQNQVLENFDNPNCVSNNYQNTDNCFPNWMAVSGSPQVNPFGGVNNTQFVSMWCQFNTQTGNTFGEALRFQYVIQPFTNYQITFDYSSQDNINDGDIVLRLGNNVQRDRNGILNNFNNTNFPLIGLVNIRGQINNWRQATVNFSNNTPNTYSEIIIFPFANNVTNQKWMKLDNFQISQQCNFITSLNDISYSSLRNVLTNQTVAFNNIYAAGNVSVLNSENKVFVAGNEVVLDPDFSVEEGGEFTAIIELICLSPLPITGNISVFVPNVMTRNCDGINDTWVVMDEYQQVGPLNAGKFVLRIYNRWGDLVYSDSKDQNSSLNGGDISWDGSSLPNGKYYYELEMYNCSNNPKLYKGYITILGDCLNTKPVLVNGENEFDKISIYPNPSNGLFTIRSMTSIDEVVICNSLGQEVKGVVDSKNKSLVEVNLTNKVKGVYFLRIRSDNEWMDKKIVIE